MAFGESLFNDGTLVHESESHVMLFGGEVDFVKATGEMLGGFGI